MTRSSVVNHPKLSQDVKELVQSYLVSFLEAYKVFMACLVSVFVPQHCPETGQTCTLNDNFTNLSIYNKFVVALNFITLGLFLHLYYVQNRRETYLITHLDADRSHAVTAFEENLKDYPKIVRRVKEHNGKLRKHTKVTMIFFVLNVIFSGVLVLYYYYDGFRTVTTLIANVLLVTSKLYSMFCIMQDCNGDPSLALSTYSTMPVGYNVVDETYRSMKEQVKSIELQTAS